MKSNIYKTCLLFLFLVCADRAIAQVPNYSISPEQQCYVPNNSSSITAALSVTVPGATTYSWVITVGPNGCAPISTLSLGNGTLFNATFNCCGVYTINCHAYSQSGIFIPGALPTRSFEIVCPSAGTLSSSGTTTHSNTLVESICDGNSFSLTHNGVQPFVSNTLVANTSGITYTIGNNPATLTPSANTSYTMISSTAVGCTVATTKTVEVQKAELTISPTASNMCNGLPLVFNSTVAAMNTTNYSNGTNTTSLNWFAPNTSVPFANTFNVNIVSSAGNYSAVLIHNGAAGSCSAIATASINNNLLNPYLTSQHLYYCPSTIAWFNISINALTNYSLWSPGGSVIATNPATNFSITTHSLLPASYTLTSDSAGCIGSYVYVLQKKVLQPQLSANNNSVCAGMPSTLSVHYYNSGFNSLYNFTLSNITSSATVYSGSNHVMVVTPSIQTTYQVKVDSSSCEGVSSPLTVFMLPPLNLSITASSNTNCIVNNGDQTKGMPIATKPITLTTTGIDSYSWSPVSPNLTVIPTGTVYQVQPLTSTCYTLNGLDIMGCVGSAVSCITVNPQFTIAISPSQKTICVGESINLSAAQIVTPSANPLRYKWQEEDQVTTLNNTTGSTVKAWPTSKRTYSLTVTDANNCISPPAAAIVEVASCTNINELNKTDLRIFPNPFENEIFIEGSHSPLILEIRNALGQLILSKEINAFTQVQKVETSMFSSGVYLFYLRNASSIIQIMKLAKP